MQDFVREIRDEHDATILLCTHDMAEAEVLAERVGIIDRGRLMRLERPAELIAHYGASDLEEAFLAATGRELGTADEEDDEDDRRCSRDATGRPAPADPGVTSGQRAKGMTRAIDMTARPDRRRVRDNLVGLGGVVERNVYLTRRYIWWDLAFFVWTSPTP